MQIGYLKTKLSAGIFLILKLSFVKARHTYKLEEVIQSIWDGDSDSRYVYSGSSLEEIMNIYQERNQEKSNLKYVFEVIKDAAKKENRLGIQVNDGNIQGNHKILLISEPDLIDTWEYIDEDSYWTIGESLLYKHSKGFALQYISFNLYRSDPEKYELDWYSGYIAQTLPELAKIVENDKDKKNILRYISECS